MSRMKVLLILGTRPEGIKMAPLYLKMKADRERFDVRLCSTGQHKEMLNQVLDFFKIKPDYSLEVMRPNQTLSSVTQAILGGLDQVFDDFQPDIALVQGDTTTVLAGALSAFYRGVKIGHVEAGLRTWDIHTPFPEEANRVLVSKITDYHFAPTQTSYDNLIKDNIGKEKIYITGNTVTDAITMASDIVVDDERISDKFKEIDFVNKKIILLTAHRRENLGEGLNNICSAVYSIAKSRDDVKFVFPAHLNPKVQTVVREKLGHLENVYLFDPFDYPELVWIIKHCYMVLTDSGGIQEEAPTLGKPVLVMRESTERPEGIEAGTARLVGTNVELIVETVNALLDDKDHIYRRMAKATNPYGDGRASEKIIECIVSKIL